jgi:hypothetical protein
MSYSGHIHMMVDYCKSIRYISALADDSGKLQSPERRIRILEIGVDRGQTMVPLIHNLAVNNIPFNYVGVDIRQDTGLLQQLGMMEGIDITAAGELGSVSNRGPYYEQICEVAYEVPSRVLRTYKGTITYVIGNSLDVLDSEFMKHPNRPRFDLILIDGDHNYETVIHELKCLKHLSHDMSLVLCDDAFGRHQERDSFYVDTVAHAGVDGHKDLDRDRPKDKQGVLNAIKDFVGTKEGGMWLGSPFAVQSDDGPGKFELLSEAMFLYKPDHLAVEEIIKAEVHTAGGGWCLHRWNQTYVFNRVGTHIRLPVPADEPKTKGVRTVSVQGTGFTTEEQDSNKK